ncbi:hypothetical protein [Providencia phage PSTRCR_127]|nr:hypothetical protein [Providencia phage PSTRCR_127]QQV89106.1 hypothetical protein [Providencia phage PSTRCR_121]
MKLIKPFKKIPNWYLVHAENNDPSRIRHVIESVSIPEFKSNYRNCQARELEHGIYEFSCNVNDIIDSDYYDLFYIKCGQYFKVNVENKTKQLMRSLAQGISELKGDVLTIRGYFSKKGSEIRLKILTKEDENYNNF